MKMDKEKSSHERGRLVRRLTGFATALLLAYLATVCIPWRLCAPGAAAWFRDEPLPRRRLAAQVEQWVRRDLSLADFHTGDPLFDGEWLFGAYLCAGLGFGQCACVDPEQREYYVALMHACIEHLLHPRIYAFDAERWDAAPLASLDRNENHAAYLGYLNLLLGLHRLVDPTSPHADLNDRISAALQRRLRASPIALLETYPGEVYPVDNCAVIGSLGLHALVSGTDYGAYPPAHWARILRERYVDRETGLLIQAVTPINGTPVDAPRGSGTCFGLYFIAFADPALSRDLYHAVKRELAGTLFGFGGVREYPRSHAGGIGDIDSGPVVFGFSTSGTGFFLSGCRMYGDRAFFTRLYSTAVLCGAPHVMGDRLTFVSGGPLGNAILFAMLTAQPPKVYETFTSHPD